MKKLNLTIVHLGAALSPPPARAVERDSTMQMKEAMERELEKQRVAAQPFCWNTRTGLATEYLGGEFNLERSNWLESPDGLYKTFVPKVGACNPTLAPIPLEQIIYV